MPKKVVKTQVQTGLTTLPEREQYRQLMNLISVATEDVKRWVTTNLWQSHEIVEEEDERYDEFVEKFHGKEAEDFGKEADDFIRECK